jgi:transposase InsO family protein
VWLNDGSCTRPRPQWPSYVWSNDCVEGRTHGERRLRSLTLIDEDTRECLALRVARHLNCFGVIEVLAAAMHLRGIPEHIRADNGPEMTAKAVREWLAKVGAKTLFIAPGSLWENGYCEAFNNKLRDECLKQEIFHSLREARVVIKAWRRLQRAAAPHSSPGYRPRRGGVRPEPIAARRGSAHAFGSRPTRTKMPVRPSASRSPDPSEPRAIA